MNTTTVTKYVEVDIQHRFNPGDKLTNGNTVAKVTIGSPSGRGDQPCYHYDNTLDGWDFIEVIDRKYNLVKPPQLVNGDEFVPTHPTLTETSFLYIRVIDANGIYGRALAEGITRSGERRVGLRIYPNTLLDGRYTKVSS